MAAALGKLGRGGGRAFAGTDRRARPGAGRLSVGGEPGAGQFFLAYRLFGRRIGFITALLVALHTTFLEQHQNATPHGLAILTAMGAFWGFLGHLRHGDELVSLDLLVGGISLGLCLLAGGPLAFVVVAALLVLVLGNFAPAGRVAAAMPARREHIWSGWPAFRSLGVLVATAFAAGGWWELMMLYSYGGEFLTGWLWGMPASPACVGPAVVAFFRRRSRCDCCRNSSPWPACWRA